MRLILLALLVVGCGGTEHPAENYIRHHEMNETQTWEWGPDSTECKPIWMLVASDDGLTECLFVIPVCTSIEMRSIGCSTGNEI